MRITGIQFGLAWNVDRQGILGSPVSMVTVRGSYVGMSDGAVGGASGAEAGYEYGTSSTTCTSTVRYKLDYVYKYKYHVATSSSKASLASGLSTPS